MDNQNKNSDILFKATAQGFSITIHGIKEGGSWKCSVEENEVTLTAIPKGEHVSSLGEKRHYEMSEFTFSFEEAFRKVDLTDWFLCHPGKLHTEVAPLVMERFEKKMNEYNDEYPADSPMESFLRESRTEEWRSAINLE